MYREFSTSYHKVSFSWIGYFEMILNKLLDQTRVPPIAYFVVSAVFHYLGPAFAVLLFAHLEVLGVAWLRISSAALIFALWRQPWRILANATWEQRRTLIALGIVLGLMNATFYLAIARLPLGTVGAIEFLGQIVIAAIGVRTKRNLAALGLAVVGVAMLTNVELSGEPTGLLFAFANCAFFMLYVILGHRIAQDGGSAGVDRLATAMLIAFFVIFPIGFQDALPAFNELQLLLAGIAVGVCSSVIPYISDQLAMARLPRGTFALMLSLLPAVAVIIGIIVLGQLPSLLEIGAILLIMGGIAIHQRAGAGA
jgi:inner membrane transporter RhtA